MNEKEPKDNQIVSPLAKWDDNNSTHPNLIWWSRFDYRFQVEVHRVGEPATIDLSSGKVNAGYKGKLHVFDHANSNKLLLSEDVSLSYGAPFGPDIEDVAVWHERLTKFVDEELPLIAKQ